MPPATGPQEPLPRFLPHVGDEVRVTLELDWDLEVKHVPLISFLGGFLDDYSLFLGGDRTLVWRDRWLEVDGGPTAYHRTWERMRGNDTSEVWWSIGSKYGLQTFDDTLRFDVELGSPLEGLACDVRRVNGEWVPEWPDDVLSSLDPALLEGLAWDVGLESLLPTRRFLYVDGVACRALLRPVGWPPWEATRSAASGDDMLVAWRASPLGHPRLDDPLLVIRKRAEYEDEQRFELGLQIVERLDLLEGARELEPKVEGLAPWLVSLERTALEMQCDGRGSFSWSSVYDQPSEVTLEIDVELLLEVELKLGSWGSLQIPIEAEGCLRQRMTWDPVLTDRR